jgi:hypothetical protein
MSGFTIACILGNNSSSPHSISNNFKRKNSNDDDDEHQLHKRQTIEGNEIFNLLFLIDHFNSFFLRHTSPLDTIDISSV